MNNLAIDKVTGGLMTLTINVIGTSQHLHEVDEENMVGRYSYGKYMPNGIDRLLEILDRRGMKATFFVPGIEAEKHPNLIREIHFEGHEIAAHGYCMEDHSTLGDAEPELLKRTHNILSNCIGAAPVGWRAPEGLLSAKTLSYLSELGYLYDASFQDDDFPYLLDDDGGSGMVEIPQDLSLIDATFFKAFQPDARAFQNWFEHFDGLHRDGAFACLTVHPRPDFGISRPSRMAWLERFLDHTQASIRPITFKTCSEVTRIAIATSQEKAI